MKSSGAIEQKFIKFFTNAETNSDELALYEDFALKGGEMLVSEFNRSTDFNVYVIGTNLTEIRYPNIVHCMQKKRPRVVSMRNGGLKFVTFVKEDSPLAEDYKAPASFKRACPLVRG
ncbi:hypothetical protein DCAR_0622792 [Daucus carota subsp. sativus]|uniref:Uncharacterized protein n=1 Tax=Daucus carota subsp. sativus TaxID=79200 RepID=A0A164UVK5_DAUCS|nr:hypothetical protein DCAR_0622792 [Daucus carota subsp. sativus]